ncbi:MAG TPA: hypothetical protein GX525_08480 [Bacilli bacterium]|nr:hypothetical protein [Bacilli bacterium]
MAYPSFLITLTAHESNPNNVTIAFTMGLNAVKKGHHTGVLLLSDAVHLVKLGYADSIDIGAPFEPVKKVLHEFVEAGGKIMVCSACMQHNGIQVGDGLIEGIEIVNAGDVIDILTEAKTTLQLN